MAKRPRDDTFDSDSNDEYYFESDKTEDDDIASSSRSEIHTTRNSLRRFNVGSDSSSDEEMNIQETISIVITNGGMSQIRISFLKKYNLDLDHEPLVHN